ncbi:MAG: hypothetical protein FJZ60_05045 [Chlamydiae bacterium]|nr:hypothetical protein [Chlamydiota bacterium]
MKKIKPKSFLLLEILITFLLVVILFSTIIQSPLSLYKSFKINQKKLELFLEKKIFFHDLTLFLDQKKTIKNQEEVVLEPHKNYTRKAKISYDWAQGEPYSKLKVDFFLKDHHGEVTHFQGHMVVKALAHPQSIPT